MMELVINFSGGKDSTAMLALPPHRPLPVLRPRSKAQPTHEVTVWCFRKGDIGDMIDVLLFSLLDPADQRRLDRLLAMVRYKLVGVRIDFRITSTVYLQERRQMSNLERFRRKMLKAQRAYESDRAMIESGAVGLFQEERLRELDATMEKVWQKMEHRYGCRREDLEDEALRAKAEWLKLAGALDETDWYESAGA